MTTITNSHMIPFLLFVCICIPLPLHAEQVRTLSEAETYLTPSPNLLCLSQPLGYSLKEQVWSARYETSALFAGITVAGLTTWAWGSSPNFRLNSEGWFGDETGSGGADKLGHSFAGYAFTTVLTDVIREKSQRPEYAPLTAALVSLWMMTYVEIFDGYSDDHGFSYEDMVMNAGGIGFACLRQYVPALRETVDFRLEYWPSGYEGTFRPLSDYSGQRYLLALKLGGFELFQQTPLRYFEIQGGYYARGFSDKEDRDGREQQRTLYAGIGLNLGELFFGRVKDVAPEGKLKKAGRLMVEHFQVPITNYRVTEKNL